MGNFLTSSWASCQMRKLRVAHAPGMPETFFPPQRVSNPAMHHGTCVTHVPWCMVGSLISGYLWSRRRGTRSRHSQRMHNPQFCVSGKRPIARLWGRKWCNAPEFAVLLPCNGASNPVMREILLSYGTWYQWYLLINHSGNLRECSCINSNACGRFY